MIISSDPQASQPRNQSTKHCAKLPVLKKCRRCRPSVSQRSQSQIAAVSREAETGITSSNAGL